MNYKKFDGNDITHKCQECGDFFRGKKCICGWELQGEIHMVAPCCVCGEPSVSTAFNGKEFYNSSKLQAPRDHRFCYNHLQKAWSDAYKPNVTPERIKSFRDQFKKAPLLSATISRIFIDKDGVVNSEEAK